MTVQVIRNRIEETKCLTSRSKEKKESLYISSTPLSIYFEWDKSQGRDINTPSILGNLFDLYNDLDKFYNKREQTDDSIFQDLVISDCKTYEDWFNSMIGNKSKKNLYWKTYKHFFSPSGKSFSPNHFFEESIRLEKIPSNGILEFENVFNAKEVSLLNYLKAKESNGSNLEELIIRPNLEWVIIQTDNFRNSNIPGLERESPIFNLKARALLFKNIILDDQEAIDCSKNNGNIDNNIEFMINLNKMLTEDDIKVSMNFKKLLNLYILIQPFGLIDILDSVHSLWSILSPSSSLNSSLVVSVSLQHFIIGLSNSDYFREVPDLVTDIIQPLVCSVLLSPLFVVGAILHNIGSIENMLFSYNNIEKCWSDYIKKVAADISSSFDSHEKVDSDKGTSTQCSIETFRFTELFFLLFSKLSRTFANISKNYFDFSKIDPEADLYISSGKVSVINSIFYDFNNWMDQKAIILTFDMIRKKFDSDLSSHDVLRILQAINLQDINYNIFVERFFTVKEKIILQLSHIFSNRNNF